MKNLLMLNLGNYFVTAKGGFCPQRIEEYSKHFDHVDVFCLGDKGIRKFNDKVTIHSGNILKWFSFFKKIKNNNIKFVKIQDYSLGGFLGVLFSKKLKTKLVMRCGGTWEHKNNSVINVLKNLIILFTKSIVLSNVSKIVFNSQYIKNKIIKNRKINNSVIYNGVNLKKFYPVKNKKFENKIIFVGRVRKDKGLLYLRDAMTQLPEYNLTIVGDGPLLKELNKEKNICCIGKKSHDEIPQILRKHDIFVLPSLPESSESFPSSLLEAMASGLGIIATRVAGIPEMIEEEKTGILVEPRSSKELIESLKKLNDKKLRVSLREESRKKILKNYDKDIQLKKLSKELF